MSRLQLRSNIRAVFYYDILSSLLFLAPVFILYVKGKFGLSDAMMLQTVFVVSSAIFEVPAGVFADKFGRKASLIVGSFLLTISLILYGMIDSFNLFILIEAVIGLSYAFKSGTSNAILYESMLMLKRESEYKKVVGKINQYSFASVAVASIIGGLIADISLEYTFFATSFSSFLAMLVAFRIEEPRYEVKKEEKSFIKGAFSELLMENRALRYVFIISLMIFVFNQVLFFTYQPYFEFVGIDIIWFGAIMASFQIVAGFASRYAHIFEKSFGFLKSLWVLFAITIIGIFLLGNVVGVFSFVFIYLQQIVRGVRPVIVGDFIHKNISSRYRTTVLSLQSFLTKIVYVPFMLYMSSLTDRFSLTMSINIMGITATIFMFITVVGSILSKKRRAKEVQDARG